MTLLWLIVWVLSDTPNAEPWSVWFVALLICALMDVG